MADYTKANLRRIMSNQGLSHRDVVQRTGLDRRTIRGLLDGTNKPHPQTIHRLAEGLGVAADEFFVRPAQLIYRHFDRHADAMVDEAVQNNPSLFDDWTEADFNELHNSYAVRGDQTSEGILAIVREMNCRRDLRKKLTALLESSQAEAVSTFLEVMYKNVVRENE